MSAETNRPYAASNLEMRFTALIMTTLAALPVFAQSSVPPQPPLIYAVNSASRRVAQTPETGLAPGSLCDVDVTGLYVNGGPLAQNDPVTLRFREPGAAGAQDLTIIATQGGFGAVPTRITGLIPADTPVGQAEILAVSASGKSFSTVVWIGASNFGIFTKAGAAYDAAAAQVWRGGPVPTSLTAPVHAGEWVTLWGTGLGPSGSSDISVNVAGVSVPPAYVGPSGITGVDQINFQFPAGVPDDCYIPIAVIGAGSAGNTPTIAAATGTGACHHRLGLTADALATLDAGGQVPLSQSWVHSDVLPTPDNPALYSRSDTVSLSFTKYDAAGVQLITGVWSAPVVGCAMNSGGTTAAFLLAFSMDAGSPVVAGPGGVRLPMSGMGGFYNTTPSSATYSLDAVPPSSFVPGDWAVQVPGGKDIGAFQASLRLAPSLRWINRGAISPVSRTSDLVLQWDPNGYTDVERMQGSIGTGADAVICRAPATAGSITIPASLIAQLPSAITTSTGKPMVELLLSPRNDSPSLYSVPVPSGASFPGMATFSYLEMVWADFQ